LISECGVVIPCGVGFKGIATICGVVIPCGVGFKGTITICGSVALTSSI
tara:strand:+ start:104 stop:250 length:147 start_codon:yes stop_codon:yes gene_type:complete